MKAFVVFGTRPETISLVPVVLTLREEQGLLDEVCVTAQHRQMLDRVLDFFLIEPEQDLNIMKPGQDLTDITCNILAGLRTVLRALRPDMVLVQGIPA